MCLLYLFYSRMESKLPPASSNVNLSGTYFLADNFFVCFLNYVVHAVTKLNAGVTSHHPVMAVQFGAKC
jgi:hypothetical protein